MKKRIIILFAVMIGATSYLILTNDQHIDKSGRSYWMKHPKGIEQYLFEQKQKAKGRKRYDKPDKAMQYEVALRSEKGGTFSYSGDWRFKAHAKAEKRVRSLHKQIGEPLVWTEHGPNNIGGRSRTIVVHPNDPDTWWVGAVGGGIWKTDNRGMDWRSQSDDMPVISVTTMDHCEARPNILYAGTGEGFYNYDAVVGDGIFKTENGGEQWIQLASTSGQPEFRFVNRIIVHPRHADTLLAATNSGLYRSLDGGEHWLEVFNNDRRVQQIIANPLNFRTQFIAVNGSGIYKSTDMGVTWRYTTDSITDFYRIELAMAPTDTTTLYASFVAGDGGLKGFYGSFDAGESWQLLGTQPNWFRNQGWYDNTLIVHPFDPKTVFVGGIDLYKVQVSDGSMRAKAISHWYGGNGLPYVHADQHFLLTIPRPDSTFAVVAANDGGIHYSPDGGVSWESRNNNYNVTQFYDGDRHPFSDQFIAGSQDNGSNLSPEQSVSNSGWQEVVGGDGFDCAWHKSDPSIIYATLYSSYIYRSNDGGRSFSSINNGLPESDIFHTPLLMSPHDSDHLLTASGQDRIYYTEDGGDFWQPVSADLGGFGIIRMAFSQKDSNVVWASSRAEHINLSIDGGKSFQSVSAPDGIPNYTVTGIATSPHDAGEALIFFGVSGFGKIYRTEDYGNNWQDITANLPDVPVHCGVIMPQDSAEIWIGTDIGLFISQDAGQSWTYADHNLPAVSIRRLKIVGQEVVAATHGRGVWSVHYDQLPEPVIPLRTPVLHALNPPNPNTNRLFIRFMPRSDYDSVIVRVNGDRIETLTELPVYRDTSVVYPVEPPQQVEVLLEAFKDDSVLTSENREQFIYTAVDSLAETFDDLQHTFSGDFLISKQSGFNSPNLHTPHPYANKRDYTALLHEPIIIGEESRLTYKDVAIVESGESGTVYPDFGMWDYVTVEGSSDGQNWDILIEPYDCRFNTIWNLTYENQNNGTEAMYRSHAIDLHDFYEKGKRVYLRFRLFADDYTTGWGWAIDNINVNMDVTTTIADASAPVRRFHLYDNYPNPFNPVTRIRFSIRQEAPVTLIIYNAAGQRVQTLIDGKEYKSGSVHEVIWNGTNTNGIPVASGMYFYRLTAGKETAIKKMLFLQ